MAEGVVLIYIIAIVFPVFGVFLIIGWVDVDTIHLASVQVLQQLQGMVVICLDERVPKVAVRRIADRVDGLEIGVNGLAEFRHADKLLHRELCRGAFVLIEAGGNTVLDLEHGIKIVDMGRF